MFSRFATWASVQMGRGTTFIVALILISAWFIAGFWVGFSNTLYQLLINTGTTIVTFLAVFLLQHTANRDMLALHLKLDEIIRASAARNELRGIEKLPDTELQRVAKDDPLA